MLRVAIRKVRADHIDLLREWLGQANGPRRQEALATLVDEGCRHEQAYLIDGADGPVMVYVMEVVEVGRPERAAEFSPHPIDADHKRVMSLALAGQVNAELLLDLSVAGPY
jgi:hypothetical protein